MKILFLTLDTFSRSGGIQQFNRSLQKALCETLEDTGGSLVHWSLYDETTDGMPDYGTGDHFQFLGFAKKKAAFLNHFARQVSGFDLVIFGHVNLSLLVFFSAVRKRKKWMVAHGIEVWDDPGKINRASIQRMDRILPVSRFTLQNLQNESGISPEKLSLFPNCLDPFFAAAPIPEPIVWNKSWRLDVRYPYLLTLARLRETEEAKGYGLVIALLPELIKEIPDLRYILAGKWDAPTYTRIRQLADTHGVGDRVLMPGFVPAASLPALYNLSQVFVMPSTKEGFGIVYLEAAWFGCQVVGSFAGGVPEALMQGALGALVPPGDNTALKTAILNSLQAGRLQGERLQQRREKIASQFGFEAMKSRIKALLNS